MCVHQNSWLLDLYNCSNADRIQISNNSNSNSNFIVTFGIRVDERVCVCVDVYVCKWEGERKREEDDDRDDGGEWKGEHIEEESISRDQHRGLCIPCEQVSRFSWNTGDDDDGEEMDWGMSIFGNNGQLL